MKILSLVAMITAGIWLNGLYEHGDGRETAALLPINEPSSEAYNLNEAKKRGDVIWGYEDYNIERFRDFLANTNAKKKDEIRITSYTMEGDPIFKDLVFDGEKFYYTYDNSHDGYAGQDKGIYKDICSEILMEEPAEPAFILNGCSKQIDAVEYYLMQLEPEEIIKKD
ncbi:DUF4362 domain-containing protein [Fictibacillus arsenicus]|uniref:DUF4362 domain-containing protein n=1 Tax=Fictibacillus arsenicus TaxID=255247 RepID=A0A1V3GBX2_9BACL|nr:DUF4362 domain-containing protein [Fictibacillus arsenicus]OOE14340.1 hypothetical protein UN64_03835 [Fictibacillus arsenicus]